MDDQNLPEYAKDLLKMGLAKEDVTALLYQLQQDASNSMAYDIMEVFTEEEANQFEEKFKTTEMNDTQQLTYLANEYTRKTGKSPYDRAQEVVALYVKATVDALQKLKAMGDKVESADKQLVEKLDVAIESKDWSKVKPILDELGISEDDLQVKF